VSINGQPASVNGNGDITAHVDLTGRSTLKIAATQGGKTTTTTVPLSLMGAGGVIPVSVFDELNKAGVTINVPPGGFVGQTGTPIQVSGGVADKGSLARFSVNGTDALSQVQRDGTFTVTVPGTNKTIVIAATGKNGVGESTSSKTASSVAANAAQGVRIAKVGYATKGVKAHQRIGVTITVKDRRGLLIRGAKVRIGAAKFQHRLVVRTPRAKLTNRNGKVKFTLRLRASRFTHRRRLHTVATAATPSAKTHRTTSIRLPRLAHHHS
jgi:hypothetical protein